MVIKTRNSNSLRSSNVARRMALCCGLLIVVLTSGGLVLLYAQNGTTSSQSTNPGQVAAKASGTKSMAAKNAATQSQITNSPGATIEQVHLSRKEQQAQVRVDGTGQLTYNAFRLNQPDRLVLDFSGAVVRVQERSLSSSFYPVRLVRIGQFKANVARVVIEIEEQLPYTIAESGNAVTVVFSPVDAAEAPVTIKKDSFSIAPAVPPAPVPSAATQSAANNQESKSLPGLSMQSALARHSHLEDESSAPTAKDLRTDQAQTQLATSGSIPQLVEKDVLQPHVVGYAEAQQPVVKPTESDSALHRRNWRYTINPSDTLELTFSLTPDYNQVVTVQPDGYIALRDIGTLFVAGQTLPELTESIKKAYSKLLRNPVISINPKDFEKPYVTVGGEVGKPGKIDWRGDVTLTQAIALAGGFTDTAKHSQVLLFRRVSDQWAEAKLINVKQMLSGRNLAEDPVLQPGDMLYVPKNTLSKIKPFIPIPSIGTYIPL